MPVDGSIANSTPVAVWRYTLDLFRVVDSATSFIDVSLNGGPVTTYTFPAISVLSNQTYFVDPASVFSTEGDYVVNWTLGTRSTGLMPYTYYSDTTSTAFTYDIPPVVSEQTVMTTVSDFDLQFRVADLVTVMDLSTLVLTVGGVDYSAVDSCIGD